MCGAFQDVHRGVQTSLGLFVDSLGDAFGHLEDRHAISPGEGGGEKGEEEHAGCLCPPHPMHGEGEDEGGVLQELERQLANAVAFGIVGFVLYGADENEKV